VASKKGDMTVREAGHRGGSTTSKRYGGDFYKNIGHLGGSTTSKRHGPEFYEKIGKKGGAKVRQLVRLGARLAQGKS